MKKTMMEVQWISLFRLMRDHFRQFRIRKNGILSVSEFSVNLTKENLFKQNVMEIRRRIFTTKQEV